MTKNLHNVFVSDEEIATEVHFKTETEFVVYDRNSARNEQRENLEDKDVWMTGYVRGWGLGEVNFCFTGEYDSSSDLLLSLANRVKFVHDVLKERSQKA